LRIGSIMMEQTTRRSFFQTVGGGLALGPPGFRFDIFQRELPLVLEAIRYGDKRLFESRPELDRAPVWVHFHAVQERYNLVEQWGVPADWA
jgi:hypothetical protein